MIRKLANAAMAIVLASGLALTAVPRAEARGGVGLGIAAGIIGLGVLGAAAAASDGPYGYGPPPPPRYYSRYDDGRCYRGPRRCGWTDRRCFENDYGDTVCRGGRYVCDRPLICD